MMNRSLFMKVSLLLGLSVAPAGCTDAESICAMICECEHCNKYQEIYGCYELKAQEAAAEAYECSEPWSAYLTCIEEKGTCDEEQANFSTEGPGQCLVENVGASCTGDPDCSFAGPTAFCSNGECRANLCSGTGVECTTNDDCSGGGSDLCATEASDVDDCIQAASGRD